MLVGEAELALRRCDPPPPIPASGSPWQAIYRRLTGQLATGACIEEAVEFKAIGHNLPRHNH